MSKKQKNTTPLPRLIVHYNHYKSEIDADGEFRWIGKNIEVEVLTLHFRTESMRVRSVEKFAWSEGDKPVTHAFDMPIADYFKKFEIKEKPCKP